MWLLHRIAITKRGEEGVMPHINGSSALRLAGRAIAGVCSLAIAGVMAQTAAPSNIVDVQSGDTFSGIAARYIGDVRSWAKLYDAQLSRLPDPNFILPGMRFELVSEASGKRYLRLISGGAGNVAAAKPKPTPSAAPGAAAAPAAVAAAPAAVPAAPGGPLVIGVLPNIGAAALMAQYESLKTYLERQGDQKVSIVLPANFKAFFDSTMRGDYDLAVAAPHFARVAQLDTGMIPLAMYEPRINAQLIAPSDSALTGPGDVRGKVVAFANPASLVAMYGQQWLRQQKLEAGKDYEVKGARTDMGVGRMLLSGDAVAAIMSNGEFRALPPEESARLKILDVFARIPNFILVAHPRLGNSRLASLKSQLLAFPADKDDGAAFIKATGITGIVETDDALLRELDPYLALTRRAMGVGK
jgi:phosphonate transport system substrate-binding protein